MFRKKESLPPEQIQAEPEKTPEYSAETLKMVERIDDRIADSENLLGGLGRVARERIITDPRALEEIYAPKEIGRMDLKGEHDTPALESASNGLRIKHAIKKVLTLGLVGSKHALKGDDGLVDKRKLKEEPAGEKYDLMRWNGELEEVAKNFDLDPAEINPQDFSKTYIEGKRGKGAEKIILKQKTEQEADKTASDIIEKQLKNLEIQDGTELVKQKQGLEEFKKDKKQYEDVLPPESREKLDREEVDRREIIDEKEEALDDELNIFRKPLKEHREDITYNLSRFSLLLEDLTEQEKAYQSETTKLQKAITGIKGSKELSKSLGDDVKEWEEQKTQTEANLKDLKERREALNLRITELKKNQTEVDAALDRINSIGKTKAEKAEEEKQKREEQRCEREAEREQGQRARGQQQPENIVRRFNRFDDSETEEETALTTERSDLIQSRQASSAAGKSSEKSQPQKKQAGPKLKTENNPLASAAETEREDRENTVRKVSQWLDSLGLNNAPEAAETAIENNFKIGKSFNLTNTMTLTQARQNYAQYLADFLKIPVVRAQKQAQTKFEKIIKNLQQ